MNIGNFLHAVLPSKCACCGKVIAGDDNICLQCASDLPVIRKKSCRLCGAELDRCNCKKRERWYLQSISPFYYERAARNAVLNIKYRRSGNSLRFLAVRMVKSINKNYNNINFDLIVPVPMYNSKKRKRGYNQSEDLAKQVAKILKMPIDTKSLMQIQNTSAQHNLSAGDREANVSGAYSAKSELVCNKSILLVDDIITTGATLNECSRVLKLAGAKDIYCVTATTTPLKINT